MSSHRVVDSDGLAVDVIIPNWNGSATLPRLLECLAAQTVRPTSVVIVDDASPDRSEHLIPYLDLPVRVLRNVVNLGFAGTANRGINSTSSRYVALINNDAFPEPSWLESAISHFSEPDVAAVATLMVDSDRPSQIDNAGLGFTWSSGIHPRGRGASSTDPYFSVCRDILAASGGAVVYRRSHLPSSKPFDEALTAYNEDADLGWNFLARDLRSVCCTAAVVHHLGGRSYSHASARHAFLQTRNQIQVLFGNLGFPGLKLDTYKLLFHILRESGSYALRHRHPLAVGKALLAAALTYPRWTRQRAETRSYLQALDTVEFH